MLITHVSSSERRGTPFVVGAAFTMPRRKPHASSQYSCHPDATSRVQRLCRRLDIESMKYHIKENQHKVLWHASARKHFKCDFLNSTINTTLEVNSKNRGKGCEISTHKEETHNLSQISISATLTSGSSSGEDRPRAVSAVPR